MNRILSLLLTFVFINAQAFAISGGPKYDDQVNVDLVGTYSGVLIPTDPSQGATTATGSTSLSPQSINSMGLFSLGVPATGPATGSFLAFSDGIIFAGTITAVGDPSNGKLAGLLEASYNYSLSFLNPGTSALETLDVTAKVTGTLQATVEGLDTNISSVESLLLSLQRIEGEAAMAVNLGFVDSDGSPTIDQIINFTVDGVKQSSSVVAASLEANNAGN